MKINKTLTALIAGASLGLSGQAFAANGTDSGTLISNTASLKYTVNSVDQDDITNDATFLVATRVDFTLSTPDNTATTVTPGGTDYVLTYDITNEGNAPFDFSLSALNMTTGGTTISGDIDNSDMASIGIFADTNGNGSYDSGTDLAITFLDEVAADDTAPVRFFIVADAPTTLTDKQIAGIDVTALVKAGGGASSEGSAITATAITDAFNPAIVQVVVANSTDTVTDTYLVGSAVISVAKTVTVISDPLCDNGLADYTVTACTNDASYIPKAIPGARVKYTVVVDNDALATSSATGLVLTDDLNIDGNDIDSGNDFDVATISAISVDSNLAVDADVPTANDTDTSVTSGVVTATFSAIAPSEDVTISFTVDLL
jgi:hypothetical protein